MPTGEDVARFFLIFLRVSSFVSFAPPFGGRDMPVMARAGLSLLASILLVAWVPAGTLLPRDPVGWALAGGTEIMVGLVLAGFWSLFLGGVQMGGHLIGAQLGFGWGGLFDPSVGDSSEAMVLFMRLSFFLLFFSVDGHLRVMEVVVRSLSHVPLGTAALTGASMSAWSSSFGGIFVTGFKLAAPVTAAIWILTMALGLVGRAAPQMNLLSLDFPLRMGLGFIILALSAPHLIRLGERLLSQFVGRFDVFARALAPL